MTRSQQALSPGIYRCQDLPSWWCLLPAPAKREGYVEVGLKLSKRRPVLIQGYVTATHLFARDDGYDRHAQQTDQC